ncbi:MAG: 5'-3' exonuclease H3TH domain-containing protein, partial [Armatimonadota bacterium]
MYSKGKVILIDGNSLLYRAFFALPHFSTLENQPTNAVYGLTMMLLRLLEEEKPDIIIVAFDSREKTFRHGEFTEYKAHRKPIPDELVAQIPIAREVIDALSIPVLEVAGVEADDVVGTVARKAESEDYDVLIVTGDLDALQLVDQKVHVMVNVKGVTETIVYDEDAVEDRYGLKPWQLPDYKALKGDPSDNIPGVPSIGDKTASKLVKEYGSLENILSHAGEVEPAKLRNNLLEFAEQAKLSKRLATIVTDVPIDIELEKCKYRGPDYKRLRELFRQLEFRSLLKRLPDDSIQKGLFDYEDNEGEKSTVTSRVLRNKAELKSLVDEIHQNKGVVIRIHGSEPRGIEAEPLGIALSTTQEKGYYIPLDESTSIKLDDLRIVLESDAIPKYGYNLKYDYELAMKAGIALNGPTFDVLLAAYLLNPTRGNHE